MYGIVWGLFSGRTEGTARYGMGTFCPPQGEKNVGLPEGWYGKRFPFVYRGMGMGRERGKPLG